MEYAPLAFNRGQASLRLLHKVGACSAGTDFPAILKSDDGHLEDLHPDAKDKKCLDLVSNNGVAHEYGVKVGVPGSREEACLISRWELQMVFLGRE